MPGAGAPKVGALPGLAGTMVMFCGAPVFGLIIIGWPFITGGAPWNTPG